MLLPVYGRRRIGKSELLVHFCSGKRAIYFAATQGTAAHQLRSFMRCAAESLGAQSYQQLHELYQRLERRERTDLLRLLPRRRRVLHSVGQSC